MDLSASLQKCEQSQGDKKRTNEGVSVILEQQKAVEEAMNAPLRRFRLEPVSIDTLSGQPLVTKMWVTDEAYLKTQKKEKEVYKCEVCNKTFDKRQKMLLHARFHTK
ncbi:uncharacterized protein VICG_01681 [Vittaforma corneae ATCC 50505]|uniref:C2H2-type domain-containing protein n=1 Tax=Vittaforma corneae (strain ATCC 50505) TaxID=993615 RepID=L2GKA0_VITCO|nr:uncharacterized protein VICG_01681 [Vittaforma corneae ATCC 50505]ELA41308.1 hypothetical protein VICG_01681 [Vittaforma corneae ATCC 50505]